MDRLISALLFALAPVALSAPSFAQQISNTDYMGAVRQELSRLSVNYQCDETTATCSFTDTDDGGSTPIEVTVRYSASTETIYVAIEKYLPCTSPQGPSQPLAVALLSFNRKLVTSKLEWDETTRHIRISTVLSTDTNFDRKAFRSQLKGLLLSARSLHDDLQALATGGH